jgi:hypothetical protein
MPLNRKRRNSISTESNCRTACLGWGGRSQFDFGIKSMTLFVKKVVYSIKKYLSYFAEDTNSMRLRKRFELLFSLLDAQYPT